MTTRPILPKLWPERTRDTFARSGIVTSAPWSQLVAEAKASGRDARNIADFVSLPSTRLSFATQLAYGRRLRQHQIETGVPNPIDAEQTMRVQAWCLYSLRRWEHVGQRVFMLDRELFDLLAATPLPHGPASRLQLPTSAFYLLFPNECGLRFANDPHEEPQPVEGVLVTLTLDPRFDDDPATRDNADQLLLHAVGRSKLDPGDDNVFYQTFNLSTRRLVDLHSSPDEVKLAAGVEDVAVTVPRVAVNFCLYMLTDQPLLEPVPPNPRVVRADQLTDRREHAREAERVRELSRLGYTWVGQKPERRVYAGRGAATGRKIEIPVPVRAHWRWQAHGPKHTLHKLILIEEHWRGIAHADDAQKLRASRVQHARQVPPPPPKREAP